jgi:hypothetical protein
MFYFLLREKGMLTEINSQQVFIKMETYIPLSCKIRKLMKYSEINKKNKVIIC